MASFNYFVVAGQKRSDGTYGVKIRCTHKRRSRWLATNVTVTDADLTRGKKIKNPYIVARCNALVKDMRDAAADLSPFSLEEMNVDAVVEYVRNKLKAGRFKLDFFQYGERIADGKSVASGKVVRVALNAFERFLGRREVDVNEITAGMVRKFVEFLDNEPKAVVARKKVVAESKKPRKKKGGVSWTYIVTLRSIYRSARAEYNDEDTGLVLIPRTPFERVEVKEGVHSGQRNLGPDTIQAMIDTRECLPFVRYALDAFIVSFCLMGANLADLYEAAPPVDGWWGYERCKTRGRRSDRARMRVAVPWQLEPFLARLKDPAGQRWLRFHLDGKNADAITLRVNRGLRRWAKDNGIERFTFYAARHSWASIARSAAVGIDKATVDDCLNHSTMKVADIYIERDYDVFAEANRRVLEIFDFSLKKI